MEERTRLRLRAVLSSWLAAAVVISLAVGAAGAWATYTAHVAPGTTTEETTTEPWSVDTGFDHSATVTRENPLFPVGTELENRTTYFRAAAPELDGAFTVAPRGLDGDVSVDLAATLVLANEGDEGTTYWTDTRPLDSRTATGVDGPVSLAFSLNVTEVADRIAAIEEGIGSTPGATTAAVVVDARVTGAADGGTSSLSVSRSLSVGLNGDTYTATAPGPSREAVERTVATEVPRTYGPLRSVGGPVALLLGAVGVGALATVGRSGELPLDDAERARLEFLDDRDEFDEWIVSVELPPRDPDRPVAEAATLADLVNLAIDSDAAVLATPDEEAFAVVADGYRYTYRPPPPSGDGTLPFARLGSDDGAAAGDRAGDASADGSPSAPVDGSGNAAAAADGDGSGE